MYSFKHVVLLFLNFQLLILQLFLLPNALHTVDLLSAKSPPAYTLLSILVFPFSSIEINPLSLYCNFFSRISLLGFLVLLQILHCSAFKNQILY